MDGALKITHTCTVLGLMKPLHLDLYKQIHVSLASSTTLYKHLFTNVLFREYKHPDIYILGCYIYKSLYLFSPRILLTFPLFSRPFLSHFPYKLQQNTSQIIL